MSGFAAFFLKETKRFFSKRNLLVLLLIYLLSFYFINIGIADYKGVAVKEEKFKKLESGDFERVKSYTFYGLEGIDFVFSPSIAGILFKNTCIPSDLYANVNSIANLKIFCNYKGKSLFTVNYSGTWDFSMIILIFGSILVLFWGYETYHNKEYLKFLSSLATPGRIFCWLFVSRLILIILSLLFLALFVIIVLWINGITLVHSDYINILGYLLAGLVFLVFFFAAGCVIGFIRSKAVGIAAILVIWSVFIFLFPGFVQTIVEENAVESTADYQAAIDKFKIITEFEKRSAKEYGGRFNGSKMELARKIIEGYWNDDNKDIEALEEGLKKEIEGNIDRYRKMAIFTPVTFYQLTGNEVSSRGYENFLEFYAYLQGMKRKFVRFYIDRSYYNDPRELVSFIKGDENVFRARSKLPKNFGAGVLINGIYILLLLGIGYLTFKRYMFHIPDKKMPGLKTLEPTIYSKKSLFIVTDDQTTKNQLYNVLNGKHKGFEGKVLVNDEDIIADPSKGLKSFVYLCHAEDIPGDIKVKHFVRFMQRLVKLSKKERARFYVEADLEEIESKRFEQLPMKVRGKLLFAAAQLRRSDCYVFNDFARGMTIDFLVNMRDEFSRIKEETKAAIIYLTPDYLLAKKTADITIFLDDDPFIWKLIKNSGLLDDNKNKTQTAIT
jgi:ABC-type Na+ transport system ATPase subunit NatA/ABC-type transport system involved in multi-copper enzyme maturation permease subunit